MTRSKTSKRHYQSDLTKSTTAPSNKSSPVVPAVHNSAPSNSVVLSADWKGWQGAHVSLQNVPPGITRESIISQLQRFGGYISHVDTKTTTTSRRQSSSQHVGIIFTRLPNEAFWSAGHMQLKYGPQSTGFCSVPVMAQEWTENPQSWSGIPQRRILKSGLTPQMLARRIRSPTNGNVTYPAIIKFEPIWLTFGVMTRSDAMMEMRRIISDPVDVDLRQEVEVDLDRRQVRAFFGVPSRNPTDPVGLQSFKAIIDFDNLSALYYVGPNETEPAYLRLSMHCPPPYYWFHIDNPDEGPDGSRNSQRSRNERGRDERREKGNWKRVVQIGLSDEPETSPASFHVRSSAFGFIDIGRWRTLRFAVSGLPNAQETMSALRDFNLPLVPEPKTLVLQKRFENPVWNSLDNPSQSLTVSESQSFHHMMVNCRLAWPIRYQVEVCLTKNVFEEHSVTQKFINALCQLPDVDAHLLLEQAADYHDQADHIKGTPLFDDAMDLLESGKFQFRKSRQFLGGRIPHYCALVRKAVITPTTIYFQTPAVESTNRVLRKFSDHHDRFLRVQFSDELLNGRISSGGNNGNQYNQVYFRIFSVLSNGIRIGDRVFRFLACGNSQMREGGAYFFADTPELTGDMIRTWMGDFSSIKSVAKRAARLGQCFSTTRAIRGVSVPSIVKIPDIQRNGFCYTDGVGKISKFLASLVMEEMELFTGPGEPIPAAYQFRMGGCKGVLVVSDKASGREVHIRKSQEKFQSQFNGLEIIRVSQFAIATLNRQTIIVLSSLGVPDSAFTKLLDDQLRDFEKAMNDATTAVTLLTQYIDENAITLQIADMVKAGFLKGNAEEPFVMSVMNLWRTWSLKLLKEKARIIVPQGAFLLGCVDEEGLLRGHSVSTEGSPDKDVDKLPQIFVRIPDPENAGQFTTIEGICIVGRNPSLHPGDIRVVQAVNIPAMNHLTNVVVFPSTGDRDVPSMLSGGDLDGDDFFVIWDQTLIPPQWNHPPMPATPIRNYETEKEITTRHLEIFFVKYLRGDVLPIIAHAHLAWADLRGAKSRECLQLAQLHSKAVDYIKTGDPAEMPPYLNPKKWPHYMEKRHRSQYHSNRPLGVIYDCAQKVEFSPFYTKPMYASILSQTVSNDVLVLARSIKSEYDMEMRRLMGQFEIDTEFEMWTTFVLGRPRVGTGYKLQERIGKEVAVLKRNFRELCIEKTGGLAVFSSVRDLLVAMYQVTAAEVKKALVNLDAHGWAPTPENMPLISLPWIFPEWMCKLTGKDEKAEDAVPMSKFHAANLRINAKHRKPLAMNTTGASQAVVIDDGRVVKPGELLDLFGGDDIVEACETKPLEPIKSGSTGSMEPLMWEPIKSETMADIPPKEVLEAIVPVLTELTKSPTIEPEVPEKPTETMISAPMQLVELLEPLVIVDATPAEAILPNVSKPEAPVPVELVETTTSSTESGSADAQSPIHSPLTASASSSEPARPSTSPPASFQFSTLPTIVPLTLVPRAPREPSAGSTSSSRTSKTSSSEKSSDDPEPRFAGDDDAFSLCYGMEMLDIYDASPRRTVNRRSPSAPLMIPGLETRSPSLGSDDAIGHSSGEEVTLVRSDEGTIVEVGKVKGEGKEGGDDEVAGRLGLEIKRREVESDDAVVAEKVEITGSGPRKTKNALAILESMYS